MRSNPIRFHAKHPTFILLLVGVLILGACSSKKPATTAPPASPTETQAPNATPTAEGDSTPTPTPAVEALPEGVELLQRLIFNQTIVVGQANDSAQTAVVIIPTMF